MTGVFLFLVFTILFIVFGVLFYVGSLFFQSYIYTTPVAGLAWRPAAAAVMTVFFTVWCSAGHDQRRQAR